MEPFYYKFRPFATTSVYEFQDPDSGHLYRASNRKDLIREILQYRINNQLPPIENLDMVLDHYLCTLPVNAGRCSPDIPLRRGLAATVRGGILLLKSMLYDKFASQEEADRRAEICVKCPHNVFPDKTRFVRWTDAIAKASIGSRRSKLHNDLGSCEVCTCPLRAKVFYEGDPELTEEELSKMKAVGCWQPELQLKYTKNG